jgi:hypothetical protein
MAPMCTRLAIVTMLLWGCAPEYPEAVIHSIEPPWGYNGEETAIVLHGANLYPRVQIRGEASLDLDHGFRATLIGGDSAELEGLDLVDYGALEARVPAGLSPGSYDLELQTPGGGGATLQQAFVVTDTRADHLEMTIEGVTHQVNTLARVEIQLLDPEGGDVPNPLEIQVEVSGTEGATGVEFEDTLDGQEALAGRVGVSGRLGGNGLAYVALTSSVAEDLWVTVSATEGGSVVQSDTQFLAFTAGDVASIEVTIPDDMSDVGAGDLFPLEVALFDAWGNRTEGVTAALSLAEACGDPATRFERTVQLIDAEVVEDAYATGSTGTASCPENRFYVSGTASGSFVEGSSESFSLQPGSAAQLEVEASPSGVVAGGEPLFVRVEAQDIYGNPVPDIVDEVSLEDDAGGLDKEGNMGVQSCTEFSAGVSFCQAWPWRSGEEIRISAFTTSGLAGTAPPIQVAAGEAKDLLVGLGTFQVAAGDPYSLTLRVLDGFGNAVNLDPGSADIPDFIGPHDSTTCAWSGPIMPEGSEEFLCVTTRANEAATIEVSLPSKDLEASSNILQIVNGDLASAVLDIGGEASVVAGDSLAVSVSAQDAFGNPYLVQTVTSLALYDESGEVAGEALALDALGMASASPTLTHAMNGNFYTARTGLDSLGESAPFDVFASSMDSFDVEAEATWAWSGTNLQVRATAVDTYGNVVETYTDSATLSSAESLGADMVIDGFEGGRSTVNFLYSEPGIEDILVVDDGVFQGSSGLVDVVEICEEGPEAVVLVGGKDELVQCLVSGTTPLITIDASTSAAGSSPTASWHYSMGDGTWARSSSPTENYSWDSEGRWVIKTILVDEMACASRAEATLWTADNDGQPAGPVLVEAGADSMIAASVSSGRVTLDVEATDCTGDPSAGGTLQVRTNIGEVDLSSGPLSLSGSGIELLLDGDGYGTLDWSVESQGYAGEGIILLGVASGAAYGDAEVSVTGESVSPTVTQISPAGTETGSFEELEVDFSESMLESSIDSGTVTLSHPDGSTEALSSFIFSDDSASVVIALDQTGDGGAGVWTLGLSSNIRDDSGNRLDGRYSGGASTFTLEFGDVTDGSVDILSCSGDTATFRPDGDDGIGEEADTVQFDFLSSASAAWWEIEILSGEGESVWLTRVPTTVAIGSESWGGHDGGGMIVPSGDYVAIITALDEYWNHGLSCAVDVRVEQSVETPD